MSHLAKGKSKARDTSQSLFLHSSPAGSHASLPGAGASPGAAPSGMIAPAAPPQRHSSLRHSEQAGAGAGGLDAGRTAAHQNSFRPPGLGGISLPLKIRQESTRATDRTDALWAEMQATLEEVELSASGGTRVFGPDHDRKLAELRTAQIALAQAWARSEADEAIETTLSTDGEPRNSKAAATTATAAAATPGAKDAGAGVDVSAGKAEGGASAAAAAGGSARPGSAGMGTERLGAKMEEETEVDILLARKRREANDRYFQRVNQGVLDVVARLDEVAIAMRAVEQESKDIWGENENYQESISGSIKT